MADGRWQICAGACARGSAVVSTALVGVPPTSPGAPTTRKSCRKTVWRDAEQSDRDGRAPRIIPLRSLHPFSARRPPGPLFPIPRRASIGTSLKLGLWASSTAPKLRWSRIARPEVLGAAQRSESSGLSHQQKDPRGENRKPTLGSATEAGHPITL